MRNEMVCSKRNESGHVKIKSSRYSMAKKKKKKEKQYRGRSFVQSCLKIRSNCSRNPSANPDQLLICVVKLQLHAEMP